jgi:4'-phosphopantetheinyl transferase
MSHQKFSEYLTFVSADKRKRILGLRNKEDANRTLISDLLIRSIILDKYRLISNQEITFNYNLHGKPFLSLDYSFTFNVSHSGTWIVAIVGNQHSVGIDIEEVRPIGMEVAKRFFSNEEYTELERKREQERLSYFYDLWTLKESFLKAIGLGLSVPLDSFVIREGMLKRFTICQFQSPYSYFFRQYDIDTTYKLSVCATIDGFPETIKMCNISEMYYLLRARR